MKIVSDNYLYAKVSRFVGSRKNLTEDRLDELEELVLDSTKAQAIFEAAKVSMGESASLIRAPWVSQLACLGLHGWAS